MNKKRIVICLLIGLAVVAILSVAPEKEQIQDNIFSCDNIGFIYAKPSEMIEVSRFKASGAIIRIPDGDITSAKTEVLECENIDMYLGGYKQ